MESSVLLIIIFLVILLTTIVFLVFSKKKEKFSAQTLSSACVPCAKNCGVGKDVCGNPCPPTLLSQTDIKNVEWIVSTSPGEAFFSLWGNNLTNPEYIFGYGTSNGGKTVSINAIELPTGESLKSAIGINLYDEFQLQEGNVYRQVGVTNPVEITPLMCSNYPVPNDTRCNTYQFPYIYVNTQDKNVVGRVPLYQNSQVCTNATPIKDIITRQAYVPVYSLSGAPTISGVYPMPTGYFETKKNPVIPIPSGPIPQGMLVESYSTNSLNYFIIGAVGPVRVGFGPPDSQGNFGAWGAWDPAFKNQSPNVFTLAEGTYLGPGVGYVGNCYAIWTPSPSGYGTINEAFSGNLEPINVYAYNVITGLTQVYKSVSRLLRPKALSPDAPELTAKESVRATKPRILFSAPSYSPGAGVPFVYSVGIDPPENGNYAILDASYQSYTIQDASYLFIGPELTPGYTFDGKIDWFLSAYLSSCPWGYQNGAYNRQTCELMSWNDVTLKTEVFNNLIYNSPPGYLTIHHMLLIVLPGVTIEEMSPSQGSFPVSPYVGSSWDDSYAMIFNRGIPVRVGFISTPTDILYRNPNGSICQVRLAAGQGNLYGPQEPPLYMTNNDSSCGGKIPNNTGVLILDGLTFFAIGPSESSCGDGIPLDAAA